MAQGGSLSRPSETAIIERIVRRLGTRAVPREIIGPGDDAAVIASQPGRQWVVSCDSCFEKTHFLVDVHPAPVVGYKALARAVSDLAAMGATPRFYLLVLALPPSRAGKWLDGMLAGMADAARQLGLTLLGGDTSAQNSICLSLTVMGEIEKGLAIRRNGARAGDALFVSGVLGQARLGLELLRRGVGQGQGAKQLLRRHFFPQPRVALGRWLAQHRFASAMIDLSDGFSSDLHNLCRASAVGARVDAHRIPRVSLPVMPGPQPDALQLALHGGDDYELLFSVPRRLAHRIPERFRGLRLTRIGEITKRLAILLQDEHGRSKPLRSAGWDPFRSK